MTLEIDDEIITIVLTGRRPVKIRDRDWPCIAQAGQTWAEWIGFLQVRQHADGRTIVYARWHNRHAGDLLGPREDVVAAIKRVHARIVVDDDYVTIWHDLLDKCIADLPAETLE